MSASNVNVIRFLPLAKDCSRPAISFQNFRSGSGRNLRPSTLHNPSNTVSPMDRLFLLIIISLFHGGYGLKTTSMYARSVNTGWLQAGRRQDNAYAVSRTGRGLFKVARFTSRRCVVGFKTWGFSRSAGPRMKTVCQAARQDGTWQCQDGVYSPFRQFKEDP